MTRTDDPSTARRRAAHEVSARAFVWIVRRVRAGRLADRRCPAARSRASSPTSRRTTTPRSCPARPTRPRSRTTHRSSARSRRSRASSSTSADGGLTAQDKAGDHRRRGEVPHDQGRRRRTGRPAAVSSTATSPRSRSRWSGKDNGHVGQGTAISSTPRRRSSPRRGQRTAGARRPQRRRRRRARRVHRRVQRPRRQPAARGRARRHRHPAVRLPQPGAVVLPAVQRGAGARRGLARHLPAGQDGTSSRSTGRARASCRCSSSAPAPTTRCC